MRLDDVAVRTINHLEICAGIGCFDLALRIVYGDRLRTVGHVERDSFAAAVLVARMADEALDQAPIWDDITTFDAGPWRNRVDIITAGFPCQPFSVAGHQRGLDDDRWIWPNIARVVESVRPGCVFLENVPGLRKHGLDVVLRDLAGLGFDAEWACISAGEVGAPQRRNRLWVVAHATGTRLEGSHGSEPKERKSARRSNDPKRTVADNTSAAVAFPPGRDPEQWTEYNGPQPGIFRPPNGSAASLELGERNRAHGNGLVPLAAAHAFLSLSERLGRP